MTGRSRRAKRVHHMALAVLLPLFTFAACRSPAEIPPDLPVGTQIGFRAPPLEGETLAGEAFSLDGQPSVPTVIVFYRSAQCGLCRVQLGDLQRHLPGYQSQEVVPVAVTLDRPELGRELLQGLDLGFEVVSVDSTTFQTWRVIDAESGTATPATYILDRDRVVRYSHTGRNASDRALDAELLTVLQTLDLGE